MKLKLFVRQGFTETGDREREVIAGTMDVLRMLDGHPRPFEYLVPLQASGNQDFRAEFERWSGRTFSPGEFRRTRLELLGQADAFVVIRTSLSESTAFEVAYNCFGGRRVPTFFAVWDQAPIKTTLLRELSDLVPVEYHTFSAPQDLVAPLQRFFQAIESGAGAQAA